MRVPISLCSGIAIFFCVSLCVTRHVRAQDDASNAEQNGRKILAMLQSSSEAERDKGKSQLSYVTPRDRELLPGLRELRGKADSKLQVAIVTAIWRIAGDAEEAISTIWPIIHHDETCLPDAVELFRSMGAKASASIPELRNLCESKNAIVRRTAVTILGHFGPAHSATTESLLRSRLVDTDVDVQIAACLALKEIDVPLEEATKVLSAIVIKPLPPAKANEEYWQAESQFKSAMRALGEFEDDAAAQYLCWCRT